MGIYKTPREWRRLKGDYLATAGADYARTEFSQPSHLFNGCEQGYAWRSL